MASTPPRRPGQRDLTTGPIGTALILFALPTLGSNILQSLNGSINAIWVGHLLGEAALAATSNATIIMFLAFGAVFGFGMAATILVGQAFGRRDIDAARRAFGSAIGLVLIASIVVAGAGWAFTREILLLLATPGESLPLAFDYLQVIFLGLPASMILTVMMMGVRGSGDAVSPMVFGGLASLLDAGLNPLFISGWGPVPAMGIAGSAVASLIGTGIAVVGFGIYVLARDLPLRLRGGEWRYLLPEPALAKTILAKGVPIGAQMLVLSTAGLAMIGLVNREGVDTTAAYGVTQQLWAYVQMPAMAIGAAVSAMAAQNIGAGRWDRVGQITRAGLIFSLATTSVIVILLMIFDRQLIGLFLGQGSAAMPIAEHITLVATWGFALFGMTMVYFGVVRANGAVIAPLIILAIAMYPVRIGFAVALMPVLGPDSLWWSFPLGSLAALLMAGTYYYRGGWRQGALMIPSEREACEERSHADVEPGASLKPAG